MDNFYVVEKTNNKFCNCKIWNKKSLDKEFANCNKEEACENQVKYFTVTFINKSISVFYVKSASRA